MYRYKVPGRINLIGEHTDYNDGYVLPGAVDRHLIFELEKIEGSLFHFHSKYFDQDDTCDITGHGAQHKWSKFFCEVIKVFQNHNLEIAPVRCSFGGNLPIGAGMSSSSALACGLIYALNDIFQLELSKKKMVFLASEAENASGLDGGKMDQYSIIFGEDQHVLKIDCQNYTHEMIPLDLGEYSIVLFDTGVEHQLVDTEYNNRHAECKRGICQLNKRGNQLKSLRDLTHDILADYKKDLDPVLYQRLKYVLNENQRVEDLISALGEDNLKKAGELLYKSHSGLRHDYEVSCKELDYIVDWCLESEGVLGARMMGGGFGGCVIAIVKSAAAEQIFQELHVSYAEQFGIVPSFYPVELSDGIRRVA